MKEVVLFFNKTGDASGYLGYNSKYNAIQATFRGTVPWDLKNIMDDLDFPATPYEHCNNGCKVHAGFYNNFKVLK